MRPNREISDVERRYEQISPQSIDAETSTCRRPVEKLGSDRRSESRWKKRTD